MGTSPHLQLLARVAGLFFDSFLFFLFSSFFHSFRCPKSTTTVQQELYGNYSICKCVFDELVRSDKFRILLFCHLDREAIILYL